MLYWHPKRGVWYDDRIEEILRFAEKHNSKVRGHVLVYYISTSRFVYDVAPEDRVPLMQRYIKRAVNKFGDRIDLWDVVNEGFDDNGNVRRVVWNEGSKNKKKYLVEAFKAFEATGVKSQAGYNEYGILTLNQKSDAVYDFFLYLKSRKIKIDYVGMQAHLWLESPPDFKSMEQNIRRFASITDVYLTEMSVWIREPLTDARLRRQRKVFHDVLETAFRAGAKGVWLDGIVDSIGWKAKFFPRIFDDAYQPKPAYYGVRKALNNAGN